MPPTPTPVQRHKTQAGNRDTYGGLSHLRLFPLMGNARAVSAKTRTTGLTGNYWESQEGFGQQVELKPSPDGQGRLMFKRRTGQCSQRKPSPAAA